MRISPNLASLTLPVVGLLFLALAVSRAADPPTAGSEAPDFTLSSQDGTPVSLHDFRGKWVVLYFYPKDMTPGCTIEAHNFQRDLAQYQEKNAAILGVSVDTPDSHKQFCTKEGLDFKLLADTGHEVSGKYASLMQKGDLTLAARNTFLIDPKGKVAKVFLAVSPPHHSEEVLAAIDDLEKSSGSK